MSLDKLGKQLRRDMAANPKKAAALGLMVLVALYFWGPLLGKWMSAGGSKRSAKMNSAALILTDDPAEPTQQSRARGKTRFRWERVRQLMQQDASMTPANFDPTWVDPFANGALAIAQEQTAENPGGAATEAAAAASAVSPEALTLVLGGVFVGSRSRVATINGEACHEGDRLQVACKDDKTRFETLRVVHIRRQGVVVEVGGRLVTLELSTPALAHGDEIQRQKPTAD